jgi:glycosyltransferase involved in cell wall biosynthesis
MNRPPLVSILIPVYNRERYIGRTIESALQQTWPDIEVIVVDNCSTDHTWKIVSELAGRDMRIRCFKNSRNIGPVRNWIEAARHATGEFSKILWSDDLMAPGFVETAVRCFMEHDDLAFVYSAVLFIDDDDHPYRGIHFALGDGGVFDCDVFVEHSLLDDPRFPLSPGCALFRTKELQRNLLEEFPNRHGHDLAGVAIGNDLLVFLLATLEHRRFCQIAEPGNFFRIHPGSISLSESAGKLYSFYKLAKCWFASTHSFRNRDWLLPRMNAQIWLYLKTGKQTPPGFSTIADFYPPGHEPDRYLSLPALAHVLYRQLARRIFRRRAPA